METFHNVWEWVNAVIHNWHGYVSGGALAFGLELVKKFREWEPSKKVFAGIVAFGLFASCFSAWQEKSEEVEKTKREVTALNKQLEQLSQPKFEIEVASAAIGEGYEVEHGQRENFADLYVQVSVLNHGAPSVINGCKVILHLLDGSELESIPFEPRKASIHVQGPRGLDLLPTSPSLLKVWSNTPIPTGGRGIGYVLFKFPSGTKKRFEGPGGKFIIKIRDVNGNIYTSETAWTGSHPKEVTSLPGMEPPH